MKFQGTVTGRIIASMPEIQELPRRYGPNEDNGRTIMAEARLPYRADFASLERRICAAIRATRYDVLCWHTGPGLTTHWVNGSIARQFNMRTAGEFAAPYTPIRWR